MDTAGPTVENRDIETHKEWYENSVRWAYNYIVLAQKYVYDWPRNTEIADYPLRPKKSLVYKSIIKGSEKKPVYISSD